MINIGLGSKCKAWINFLLSCCDNSGCWSTTVAITPWSNAIYTNMGCWIGEAWPNCPLFNTPTELSWWQERYRAYYHNKKQLLLLSDGKARKKKRKKWKAWVLSSLSPDPCYIPTQTSQKIISCFLFMWCLQEHSLHFLLSFFSPNLTRPQHFIFKSIKLSASNY